MTITDVGHQKCQGKGDQSGSRFSRNELRPSWASSVHVREAGGLAGEDLLADQPVVDEVEAELQHPLRRGALAVDLLRPLQRLALRGRRAAYDAVDRAHPLHVVGGVLATEEEDLAGELLAHLAGQVRAAEAAVEAGHVGVGLLELAVLGAGQREVGHHVQAVAAAGRPAGDHADDHLGHEADEALHLEDVQAAGAARLIESSVSPSAYL